MRLCARTSCDRQQLAAHVAALVRAALEPPSTFCGNGCEAVNGLPMPVSASLASRRSLRSSWPLHSRTVAPEVSCTAGAG